MKRYDMVKRLLGRYGQTVEISARGEMTARSAHAFIQPLRYKNKRYFDGEFLQGGLVDSRHFLYIGSPDVRLDLIHGSVTIQRGAEMFVVRRSEAVFLGNECIYVWAILQPFVPEP